MKTNWKIALLCIAGVAMMACQPKEPVDNPDNQNTTYNAPIKVNDQSVADWDNLDQSKISEAVLPEKPLYEAIKKIRVYADTVAIYYMLELDMAELPSHTDVDAMHIYMDADNSDETGGYFDQFDAIGQGNTDIMFEGPVWDADGNPVPYSPSFSTWAGQLNGEGWLWTDVPVSNKMGTSQFVGDNIIEGRLVLELIPFTFNKDGFTIGFDIQQNWESAGLLPQGNTPDGTLIGRAKKLYVAFDK